MNKPLPKILFMMFLVGITTIGCTLIQAKDQDQGKVPDFDIQPYGEFEVFDAPSPTFYQVLDRGTPVVLNMWAGLCPPCRAEMPDLQAVHEQYTGRIVMIGLDVGPFTGLGSREDGRALVDELKVTYPTGSTTDSQIVREYGILGMPSTYFIKPNGEVQKKWTGLLTERKLVELTDELLANSR